jgi:hypothetical protein
MFAHYLRQVMQHGRIDPVEYYVCDRYKVVYVENAKVACTAIKQLLFPEVSYRELGQDAFHQALRVQARLAPPAGTASAYLHFSFFREPVERLTSCYRDKIRSAAADLAPSIYHSRAQRLIFRLFGGIDVTWPELELGDFAMAASRIPDRLRDRHIMSQAPIHRAVTQASRSFVGRHENLAADWEMLARESGLPPLPRLNSSSVKDDAALTMPDAALTALCAAYAQDYALLGYVAPAHPAR